LSFDTHLNLGILGNLALGTKELMDLLSFISGGLLGKERKNPRLVGIGKRFSFGGLQICILNIMFELLAGAAVGAWKMFSKPKQIKRLEHLTMVRDTLKHLPQNKPVKLHDVFKAVGVPEDLTKSLGDVAKKEKLPSEWAKALEPHINTLHAWKQAYWQPKQRFKKAMLWGGAAYGAASLGSKAVGMVTNMPAPNQPAYAPTYYSPDYAEELQTLQKFL
jgi:hypothetical protein